MMLPTDMALYTDPKFKPYTEAYAADESKFFKDFASVFSRLLELGVSDQQFQAASTTGAPYELKTLEEQGLDQ